MDSKKGGRFLLVFYINIYNYLFMFTGYYSFLYSMPDKSETGLPTLFSTISNIIISNITMRQSNSLLPAI